MTPTRDAAAARLWFANVSLIIGEGLSRRGAKSDVCRRLQVHRNTITRLCNPTDTESPKDMLLVYRLLRALSLDPSTVFSAASRARNDYALRLLANGSVRHTLPTDLNSLAPTCDDHGPAALRGDERSEATCDAQEAEQWLTRVMTLIGIETSRHGVTARLCGEVNLHRNTFARLCRSQSRSQPRDIVTVYAILRALGYDPVTVFSAACRADDRTSLQILAKGGLMHHLAPGSSWLAELVAPGCSEDGGFGLVSTGSP